MEPERPVEKWLRDAAKQRRDQAGAPFELHPATRRLLQGEVVRRYGAAEPETSRGFSWARLFPRLAWGLGLAAVLGAGLWMLWPESQPADRELAMGAKQSAGESGALDRVAKPAETAPALEPVTRAFVAEKKGLPGVNEPAPTARPLDHDVRLQTTAKEAEKEPMVAARNAAVAPASKPEPAAAATPRNQELLAFGSSDALKAREHSESQSLAGATTGLEKTKDVTIPPPAAAPVPMARAEAGTRGAELLKQPVRENAAVLADSVTSPQAGSRIDSARFGVIAGAPATPATAAARPGSDAMSLAVAPRPDTKTTWGYSTAPFANQWKQVSQAQLKLEARQAAAVQVLNNFVIEREGEKLKVIDEDGSVYAGSLQATAAPARRARTAQPPATDRAMRGVSATAAPGVTRLSTGADTAAQSYYFRVVGTNRSLNQQVVFTGNLVADANTFQQSVSNALASQPTGGVATGDFAPQTLAPQQMPQSRISGKAKVGNQAEMEIIATPVMSGAPK